MKITTLIIALMLSFLGFSQDDHEKGELLIQLRSTESLEFIRNFEIEQGIQIKTFKTLSTIIGIHLIVFVDENEDLDKAIELFNGYPEVINIQKNHFVQDRETIPNDTLFNDQWHLKNTGQNGGTIDADIDATDAWDITTGGITTHNDTIVVCVIESQGVDISHVDLIDNIWHNYGEIENDGIDNDGNGYIDDFNGWNVATLDDQVGSGNHGTRVCGMIGATGNNITGVSGVNWNVKIMVIKGQDAANEATVVAAYDYPLVMRKKYNDTYGQEGAFVVVTNASFGINNADPANYPLWCAMYDTLGQYGILNIAATTNNNTDVDVMGDIPTTCISEYLLGVTMTNNVDVRANSGYGPIHIDLAAPGFLVTLPISGGFYNATSGTSFASPCVAGSVALAYSAPCAEFIAFSKINPAGAALEMKDYILSSVDVLSVLNGEVGTSGRLNVNNAIDSMLSNCSVAACIAPYNLYDIYITDTTAHFVWDGFSTDYLFYIQEGASPIIEIPLSNQDTIAFDSLTPCTNYTIWVKGICGLDTSGFSYPISFVTDGCCNNPELTIDYATVDTLVVSWPAVLYATSYDVRYRKQGDISWINTLLDTVSPITIGGLDTCAIYEFQIKTLCTDSTHGFSTPNLLSTLGCGSCYEAIYCDVIGTNVTLEWLETIIFNGYGSTNGSNNGWYQSSQILCGFEPGQTYNFSLEPGYSGNAFTERFSIWIDLDQNGIFDPSDKLLDDQSTSTILTGTISIPTAVTLGVTKMRIGMSALSDPPVCPNSVIYGEYEDHCVYLGADAGIEDLEASIFIYPNPTTGLLYINAYQEIQELSIYTQDGKQILFNKNPSSSIDISEFDSGFYIMTIKTESGTTIRKLVKQ